VTERVPTGITLHQKSRVLEIGFSDGRSFRLPYEYLRVYSPSAEVRGHGPGQEVLQVGKRAVEIRALDMNRNGLRITYPRKSRASTQSIRASLRGHRSTERYVMSSLLRSSAPSCARMFGREA